MGQRNNSSLTQAQLDQQIQSRLNRNLPNNQSLPKHYKNHHLILPNNSSLNSSNADFLKRIGAKTNSSTLPMNNRGLHASGNSLGSSSTQNSNSFKTISNNKPTYEQHV